MPGKCTCILAAFEPCCKQLHHTPAGCQAPAAAAPRRHEAVLCRAMLTGQKRGRPDAEQSADGGHFAAAQVRTHGGSAGGPGVSSDLTSALVAARAGAWARVQGCQDRPRAAQRLDRLPVCRCGAGAAAGHPDKGAVLAPAGNPTVCCAATVATKCACDPRCPWGAALMACCPRRSGFRRSWSSSTWKIGGSRCGNAFEHSPT